MNKCNNIDLFYISKFILNLPLSRNEIYLLNFHSFNTVFHYLDKINKVHFNLSIFL